MAEDRAGNERLAAEHEVAEHRARPRDLRVPVDDHRLVDAVELPALQLDLRVEDEVLLGDDRGLETSGRVKRGAPEQEGAADVVADALHGGRDPVVIGDADVGAARQAHIVAHPGDAAGLGPRLEEGQAVGEPPLGELHVAVERHDVLSGGQKVARRPPVGAVVVPVRRPDDAEAGGPRDGLGAVGRPAVDVGHGRAHARAALELGDSAPDGRAALHEALAFVAGDDHHVEGGRGAQ
ncbi:MAG: hypothetical protein M0D55_05765 [Elusimicrobiota bacterium]|nr:MAG: hypothetical protein M0D55_05765 [Elusimicrobiota bacterium]